MGLDISIRWGRKGAQKNVPYKNWDDTISYDYDENDIEVYFGDWLQGRAEFDVIRQWVRDDRYGKYIPLDTQTQSDLACMCLAGKVKEAEDELKRILRKDEKKPRIVGKCICFFKKDSNEFYYTQQLRYNPSDIQDALRCYKEWKRYIKDKNCILETGYELSEGEFNPFGENKAEHRTVTSVVDLTRCRSISVVRQTIFD